MERRCGGLTGQKGLEVAVDFANLDEKGHKHLGSRLVGIGYMRAWSNRGGTNRLYKKRDGVGRRRLGGGATFKLCK